MFARFVGKLYAEAAAFGAADVDCQENPSFFVMISRAGGVVKRMDDDWGRRTPGVAILRQQMGDAAHRESSTFPCIGDAVMPVAWPLAYYLPDAPASFTGEPAGMERASRRSEGTPASP